jgi:hypothetical protein
MHLGPGFVLGLFLFVFGTATAFRVQSLSGASLRWKLPSSAEAIQAKASGMSTSGFLKRLERIEQAISPTRPRAFEGICSGSSDPVVAAQIEAEKAELM